LNPISVTRCDKHTCGKLTFTESIRIITL